MKYISNLKRFFSFYENTHNQLGLILQNLQENTCSIIRFMRFNLPFIKFRTQIAIETSDTTPTGYLATIDGSTVQEGGLCYECRKPVVVLIMFLVAPPIAIAWFLCDACFTFAGRNRFINVLKECYYVCCFKIDCLKKISLYEAIARYEEDPPMDPKVSQIRFSIIFVVLKKRFLVH